MTFKAMQGFFQGVKKALESDREPVFGLCEIRAYSANSIYYRVGSMGSDGVWGFEADGIVAREKGEEAEAFVVRARVVAQEHVEKCKQEGITCKELNRLLSQHPS